MRTKPTSRATASRLWLLTALAALASAPVPAAAPSPAERPRLAVLMVLDGVNAEQLEALRPWYTAGLKRLLDEGRVEASCTYRHLNTETAPGHASLGTGAPPRVHGIVSNYWFRLRDGKLQRFYATTQSGAPVPGDPPMFYREEREAGNLLVFAEAATHAAWKAGRAPSLPIVRAGFGAGGETVAFDSADAAYLYAFRHGMPEEPIGGDDLKGGGNLRVDTLADRLATAGPGSLVVSVSAKDRAAIFMAGRARSHAVYWYDAETGRFVTSAAYSQRAGAGKRAAALVKDFNRTHAGQRMLARLGTLWRPLPFPASTAGLPLPVDPLLAAGYQVPVNGLLFDHDLAHNVSGYYSYPSPYSSNDGSAAAAAQRSGYYQGIYQSPMVDELTADLALALLADDTLALGRDAVPDMLCVSLSAHDTVSHSYGLATEEGLDVMRRIDLQVGRILDALDERVGEGRWVMGFSADHGFNEIPEMARRLDPTRGGGRIVDSTRTTTSFVDRLNRALADELCLPAGSEPIAALEGFSLYYDRTRLPLATVAGQCGAAGRTVGAADIDAVLPRVVDLLYREEIEGVLVAAQRASWPPGPGPAEFVRNHYDAERGGDAFLLPRPGVIANDDPGRGTGHGTHHPADTHVPLVFLGAGVKPGRSTADASPYDLAPTLAARLGVTLPAATGRDLLPAAP